MTAPAVDVVAPEPTQRSAVKHMERFDHPSNYGTGHRRLYAECGRFVFAWECAAFDDVTCPRCLEAIRTKEELEL